MQPSRHVGSEAGAPVGAGDALRQTLGAVHQEGAAVEGPRLAARLRQGGPRHPSDEVTRALYDMALAPPPSELMGPHVLAPETRWRATETQ
jgi:hypothetical protein